MGSRVSTPKNALDGNREADPCLLEPPSGILSELILKCKSGECLRVPGDEL